MLDTLYARLRRCSDIACVSGRPFTERNLFPVLSDAGGGRPSITLTILVVLIAVVQLWVTMEK